MTCACVCVCEAFLYYLAIIKASLGGAIVVECHELQVVVEWNGDVWTCGVYESHVSVQCVVKSRQVLPRGLMVPIFLVGLSSGCDSVSSTGSGTNRVGAQISSPVNL